MLQSVNGWAALLCLAFSTLTGNLLPMIEFILSHNQLIRDLALIGVYATVGQFFVYYMQRAFRQHIVPLVVGTRKIFTVGISILYFKHEIS